MEGEREREKRTPKLPEVAPSETQTAGEITWDGNFTTKFWQLYRERDRKIHSAVAVSPGAAFIPDREARGREITQGPRWCLWSPSSG